MVVPYEEITVIDKEVTVGLTPVTEYGFYVVPSNPDDMVNLLRAKQNGKVPKILRVRMYYRVEYVRPTPFTVGSGGITIIDCYGNEVRPPPVIITVSWDSPVQEDEVDLSQYFTCTAPALGLNAVRVDIGPASDVIPIPTTVYKVKVVMKWEWGW